MVGIFWKDVYPVLLFKFMYVFFRALNEMWKCQNLLRHQVKDLLDLIKQPKVSYQHFCYVLNSYFCVEHF